MTLPLWLVLLLFGGAWLYAPDLDRTELEARHAGPPSEFVELDGLRLHLRDSAPAAAPGTPATAPVLLMLHGFGSSLHSWDAFADALSPQFRVLRPDLPGAGLTGADPAGDYGDARTVQRLVALLDARGIARATVIGHSMGGRIALRLAATRPARVERLVLLAPVGGPGVEREGAAPREPPLPEALLRRMLPRSGVRLMLEAAWGDPSRLADDTVGRYHELLRAPGVREAALARARLPPALDDAALPARVGVPTLLLWGSADRYVPPSRLAAWLQAMPQARGELLPGLGHVPQEEDPAAALVPIRRFLAP